MPGITHWRRMIQARWLCCRMPPFNGDPRSPGRRPRKRKRLSPKLLRWWHERCSKTFRAREFINLAECQVPISESEIEDARVLLRRAALTMVDLAQRGKRNEAQDLGFFEWQDRELVRSSPAALPDEDAQAIAWAVVRIWDGQNIEERPEGLSEKEIVWVQKLLQADPGYETLWELRLVGSDLLLRPREPQPAGLDSRPADTNGFGGGRPGGP